MAYRNEEDNVWLQQLVGEIISVSVFNLKLSQLFDFGILSLKIQTKMCKKRTVYLLFTRKYSAQ